MHGGRTYSHGEVWHPAFRSFGPLPCILCTCQDGRQDCQRVTCPTEYPCHHPEKVAGKCCKICPGTKRCWGQGGHLPGQGAALTWMRRGRRATECRVFRSTECWEHSSRKCQTCNALSVEPSTVTETESEALRHVYIESDSVLDSMKS